MFASASEWRHPNPPSAYEGNRPPAPASVSWRTPQRPKSERVQALSFGLRDVADSRQFAGILIGTGLTLLAAFCLRRALLSNKKVSQTEQHKREVNLPFFALGLWSCGVLLVNALAVGAGELSASEVCALSLSGWPRLLSSCVGIAGYLLRGAVVLWATLFLQLLVSYVLFAAMIVMVILARVDMKVGPVSKAALKQVFAAVATFAPQSKKRKAQIRSDILSACCDNSDAVNHCLWTGFGMFGGSLITIMGQVAMMLHVCPGNSI